MAGGRARRRRGVWVWLALAGVALVLGSCSYYGQAIRGGLEIVCRKRSIERLLRDPGLDGELRRRLVAVQAMRRFAVTELGLPDNASYRSYADLGRPYVSWTVTAAPSLSLEAKTWCFPIAGCVSYRGYFAEADARRFGARLAAEGLDIDVGGVRAFSTLGWLADPVLNTFLDAPDPELAGLIFHELAHQVVYVKGDTTFNESFATVVEREGVRRWLEAHGRAEELTAYRRAQEQAEQIARLIEATRQRLSELYASTDGNEARLQRKDELLEEAREAYAQLSRQWSPSDPSRAPYAGFFDAGLNNARLAAWGSYHELVPALEALLAAEGGDLRRFYEALRRRSVLQPGTARRR